LLNKKVLQQKAKGLEMVRLPLPYWPASELLRGIYLIDNIKLNQLVFR